LYTPTACTKTTNQNLVWDEFEQFCALIISSQQLKKYAFQTYLNLSYFPESWAKYKKIKFVHFVGPNNTPPTLLQPHFEASVGMRLTFPKLGIWSPLGLPQLQSSTSEGKTPRFEVFFILLERP